MAFGDIVNNEIDDYSTSDNKDTSMILATVAAATEIFLTTYPDRYVFFSGSTLARTRLYRMAIGNNIEELKKIYNIWGIMNDGTIIPFLKNEVFTAFLIQKKLVNLIL